MARDDGDEHAIDFITGSSAFLPRKVASSHVTSVLQSPMHLSQSRKIYVREHVA